MKNRMKILSAMLFVLLSATAAVNAQLVRDQGSQAEGNWYNLPPEADGVLGMDLIGAYKFLAGKEVKASPIVAVIYAGIDVEHEALAGYIWTNPNEKKNGRDNDNNGYIGDVNGWNFIGARNGNVMEFTTSRGNREYFRLKDEYADLMFDGKGYFKYVDDKRVEVPPPTDMEEYEYYMTDVLFASDLAQAYASVMFGRVFKEYANIFDREMKAKFPGKEIFDKSDLLSLRGPDVETDSLRKIALDIQGYYFGFGDIKDWRDVYATFGGGRQLDNFLETYHNLFCCNPDDNRASIVGDDYRDITDTRYGNNVLLTPYAMAGTMMGGLIAGKRGVEGHNEPIAENARIMPFVVLAGKGDLYLKDLVLAIRYAVDNGASVIVLPGQERFYPEPDRGWVADALRYAEQKGVLAVIPVATSAENMDETTFFPNRLMDGSRELTNLMVVAATDKDGSPIKPSNFGRQTLDLYAPGVDVLSTNVGDIYQVGSNDLLAAANTAGVAALIKSYYPSLTGPQIRDILIRSVTSRKGKEVEKIMRVEGNNVQSYVPFESLTLSGGILNANNAVRLAAETVK